MRSEDGTRTGLMVSKWVLEGVAREAAWELFRRGRSFFFRPKREEFPVRRTLASTQAETLDDLERQALSR